MTASRPFTLILDDPLANSYLQNPCKSLPSSCFVLATPLPARADLPFFSPLFPPSNRRPRRRSQHDHRVLHSRLRAERGARSQRHDRRGSFLIVPLVPSCFWTLTFSLLPFSQGYEGEKEAQDASAAADVLEAAALAAKKRASP